MRSLLALLVISPSAISCAARMASTMPASVSVAVDDDTIADGVAPAEFHGIPGIFFTFEAWRNVLIKVRLQQKDLEVALASESVGREVAETEAKRLRESSARHIWAATYGPWLGLGAGLSIAAVVGAIFGGVFKSMTTGAAQ